MDITIDRSGPFAVVRPRGDLTFEAAEQFANELDDPELSAPQAKVAVVLNEVTAIDSAGLGALISLVTRSRLREGRVIIVGPSRFVRGVMEVTQLDHWFEICDDLEQAATCFA
jgi:anti-anti-sigma factor